MRKLGKIENGYLKYAPKNITWKNHVVNNPSDDKLLSLGFLYIETTDMPIDAPKDKYYENYYEENEDKTAIIQKWRLQDIPIYPEPELSSEEVLNIITGVTS